MLKTTNQIHLFFLFITTPASSQAIGLEETTQIDPQMDSLTETLNKTLEQYDRSLRPNHFGPPLRITTSLYIAEIPWTSEVDMEFSVDMIVRQSWMDARLRLPPNITAHEYIPFGYELQHKIWMPDTFFPNEKHSTLHSATVPNLYFRWYPNGRIFTSTHLTLKSSCPMNLVLFPMDYQTCKITLESWAYDTQRVTYEWDNETSMKFGENALGLLQNYQLTSYRQSKWVREYATGNFTSLMCEFILSRYVSYYVMQMYVPIALTVVISWFPFWMEGHTDWERIAIGVTTILTMTSLIRSIQQTSPKVSYITAMDVYTQTSFFMAFVSLLESTVVGYLHKRKARAAEVTDVLQCVMQDTIVKPSLMPKRKQRSFKEISVSVDRACRVALPAIFVVFNAVYWAYYLSASAIPTDPSWVSSLRAQLLYSEGSNG